MKIAFCVCLCVGLYSSHTKSQWSLGKTHEKKIFFYLDRFSQFCKAKTRFLSFLSIFEKKIFFWFRWVLFTFSFANTQKVLASKGKTHFFSFLTKFWYTLNEFLQLFPLLYEYFNYLTLFCTVIGCKVATKPHKIPL